jgi:hypothetical protein
MVTKKKSSTKKAAKKASKTLDNLSAALEEIPALTSKL